MHKLIFRTCLSILQSQHYLHIYICLSLEQKILTHVCPKADPTSATPPSFSIPQRIFTLCLASPFPIVYNFYNVHVFLLSLSLTLASFNNALCQLMDRISQTNTPHQWVGEFHLYMATFTGARDARQYYHFLLLL